MINRTDILQVPYPRVFFILTNFSDFVVACGRGGWCRSSNKQPQSHIRSALRVCVCSFQIQSKITTYFTNTQYAACEWKNCSTQERLSSPSLATATKHSKPVLSVPKQRSWYLRELFSFQRVWKICLFRHKSKCVAECCIHLL